MPSPFSTKGPAYEDWYRQAPNTPYRRRIERGHERYPNATLAQLRRHPVKGQKPLGKLKKRFVSKLPWEKLTPQEKRLRAHSRVAYYMVLHGSSLEAASAKLHMDPRTVRRHIDGFRKADGKWVAKKVAKSERRMRIYSGGKSVMVLVPDTRQASLIGRYHNAVRNFLKTGDVEHLRSFVGKRVRASGGTYYALETDPEKLYELWEQSPNENWRGIYDDQR